MIRELLAFGLVSFPAIFSIVDPFAVLPVFLAMTANDTPAQKRRTAIRASLAVFLTLTIFGLAGGLIFRFFGISLGAFKIAGGLLLFMTSIDMMQAKSSRTRSTPEEEEEGIHKADVAIIPLAIPLLAGPGSMAMVMVMMSKHKEWIFSIPVLVSIFLTSVITWAILRGAQYIEKRLSKTALNIMMRVMGLILAAIAVEFVMSGIKESFPHLARAA
jgi:multiple antibiotic resistance protein